MNKFKKTVIVFGLVAILLAALGYTGKSLFDYWQYRTLVGKKPAAVATIAEEL